MEHKKYGLRGGGKRVRACAICFCLRVGKLILTDNSTWNTYGELRERERKKDRKKKPQQRAISQWAIRWITKAAGSNFLLLAPSTPLTPTKGFLPIIYCHCDGKKNRLKLTPLNHSIISLASVTVFNYEVSMSSLNLVTITINSKM